MPQSKPFDQSPPPHLRRIVLHESLPSLGIRRLAGARAEARPDERYCLRWQLAAHVRPPGFLEYRSFASSDSFRQLLLAESREFAQSQVVLIAWQHGTKKEAWPSAPASPDPLAAGLGGVGCHSLFILLMV